MRKILLFILFPLFVYGQAGFRETPFAAADTIGSITIPDSVYMQLNDGPWKLLTSAINDTAYVTVDDKVAETTQVFMLARESYWTGASSLRFQIRATGTDTITSSYVRLPSNANGAVTLFLRPDTVGNDTYYGTSTVEGN